MFEFLKKKKNILDSDFLRGFTDIHSHVLYGVDDGVKEKNESLKMLSYLEEQGVERIYFTPHIMAEFPDNNPDSLKLRFQELISFYQGNIKLGLAAEYMIDSDLEKHLNNGDLLTISGDYVLVETSYMSPPLNFKQSLNKIRQKGYRIILAHPERYAYLDKSDYSELKKESFLYFQLNLLSLSGYYGKRVQENARYLLKNDFYSFTGSDIHNLKAHMRGFSSPLKKSEIDKLENLKKNNKDLAL